ncbi:Uncharacterized protein Adt_45143 [Abeliophyllum distichum]|uniref:Uncharacterized protein n=1 Tax=Abeliophyllum distichum TaxID=126358 RepID=A0ABD1PEA3_9LAMI
MGSSLVAGVVGYKYGCGATPHSWMSMARCLCCWSEYAMKALQVATDYQLALLGRDPNEGHCGMELANMFVDGMSTRIMLWGVQMTLNASYGARKAHIHRVCFKKTVCCAWTCGQAS